MLPLLADENFNQRILRGLRRAVPKLDCVIAQAQGLKHYSDELLLEWAAQHSRILVTHDANTVTRFAIERIGDGRPMPGVVIVPAYLPIGQAIEELQLLLQCAHPNDLNEKVVYLPL